MKAILNNEITDWADIKLTDTNRGFKYGDGLFESIALVNGKARFLEKHLERLQKGADVLRLEIPETLKYNNIANQILNLASEVQIGNMGKIKIYLWRNATGLYSPMSRTANFLITAETHSGNPISFAEKVGVSKKVTNHHSETSRFKTVNALKYVIAGIEKEERHLDEIILLDQHGFISETLASNIFIKKGDRFNTPPLSSGCIDGIMRNFMIIELSKQGFSVNETPFTLNELKSSDSVFTTNALGIRYFGAFEDANFVVDTVSSNIIDSVT